MTRMPTWDQFMAPVLRVLRDGQVRRRREIAELVAEDVELTDEQRADAIPSGILRYVDRVGWSVSRLKDAGALDRPARGQYVINAAGGRLLTEYPDGFGEQEIEALKLPNQDASSADAAMSEVSDVGATTELAPLEQVEHGTERIHAEVADDLLSRLHAQEPAFFERAVVDLLIAMGYGGAHGRARRTPLTGDGGVDGVIDEDALGLSRIYVQAKRYALDSTVGRPQIQAFVGALHGQQSDRGVFMTTGGFSRGAKEYAETVSARVVLIDGYRLADLMIRYGVGVQTKRTVQIVEVDEDFFE